MLGRYEGHLTLLRQQVSTLYREHLDYSCKAQDAEVRLKKENDELRDQVRTQTSSLALPRGEGTDARWLGWGVGHVAADEPTDQGTAPGGARGARGGVRTGPSTSTHRHV